MRLLLCVRKHQEGFHWDCCCPHGNFVLFFCSVAFSWSSMFSGSIVSHVPQSHSPGTRRVWRGVWWEFSPPQSPSPVPETAHGIGPPPYLLVPWAPLAPESARGTEPLAPVGWYWPLGHSFCRAFTLSKPRGRTSAAVHSTLLYWGKVILTDTLIKLLCNTWIKQNHEHTINRAAAHNTSGWDIMADCGCCLYNMKVFGWFMSLSLRVGRPGRGPPGGWCLCQTPAATAASSWCGGRLDSFPAAWKYPMSFCRRSRRSLSQCAFLFLLGNACLIFFQRLFCFAV